MEIAPDIMKRFLSGFQAGTGAADSSQRASVSNAEIALKAQQLAQQREAHQQELAQNQLKIAAAREGNRIEESLGFQKIALDAEKAAMAFKTNQQQADLERLGFIERLKAQKLVAENNRLEMQMRATQLEKENRLKEEQLRVNREALNKKSDYQVAVLEQKRERDEMRTALKNRGVLDEQITLATKLASDPMKGAQFRTEDGQIDQQKVYDFAAANTQRILNPDGMSKSELSKKEETPGLMTIATNKIALAWAEANPDDPRAQKIKAKLGVK